MLNTDIRLMKAMRKELAIRCFEKKCLIRSDSMMKCWFAIKMTNSTTGLPNMEKDLYFTACPIFLFHPRDTLQTFPAVFRVRLLAGGGIEKTSDSGFLSTDCAAPIYGRYVGECHSGTIVTWLVATHRCCDTGALWGDITGCWSGAES